MINFRFDFDCEIHYQNYKTLTLYLLGKVIGNFIGQGLAFDRNFYTIVIRIQNSMFEINNWDFRSFNWYFRFKIIQVRKIGILQVHMMIFSQTYYFIFKALQIKKTDLRSKELQEPFLCYFGSVFHQLLKYIVFKIVIFNINTYRILMKLFTIHLLFIDFRENYYSMKWGIAYCFMKFIYHYSKRSNFPFINQTWFLIHQQFSKTFKNYILFYFYVFKYSIFL